MADATPNTVTVKDPNGQIADLPQEQLKDPFFKQFLVKKKKIITTIDELLDIDILPSYSAL